MRWDNEAPHIVTEGEIVRASTELDKAGIPYTLVMADLDRFNAFNLFAIDGSGPRLLTNRPRPQISSLGPGVHALANEPVDRPCPRAERLRATLAALVGSRSDPEGLLDTLTAEGDPALELLGDVLGHQLGVRELLGADHDHGFPPPVCAPSPGERPPRALHTPLPSRSPALTPPS